VNSRRPTRPGVEPLDDGPISLRPPRGLEADTFKVGDDEYVVLAFPLETTRAPEGLTEAEREVVAYALEGLTNGEIARRRGTSPNTVANQLRAVYQKFGVSGRLELVRRCAGPT
jgi:DNA-binding CsgD family transcriptional regulator